MKAKKTNLQHYIDNIMYDAGCIMSKIINCEGDCDTCKYDDSSKVAEWLMEEYKTPIDNTDQKNMNN